MTRSFARPAVRGGSLLAAVALLGFATSCRPERPAGVLDEARRADDGAPLELTARLSPTVISVGEQGTLTLTLRNTTDSTVTLVFGEGCQLLPYIEGEEGDLIFPRGGWGCVTVVSTLVLPPEATRSLELPVHGGAPSQAIHAGASLPPGRYRAYGALGLPPDERLRSDTIAFRVVD